MGKMTKDLVCISPRAKRWPKLINWMTLGDGSSKANAAASFTFASQLIAKSRTPYKLSDSRMEPKHWKLAQSYIVRGMIQLRVALGRDIFDALDAEARKKVYSEGWWKK